MPRLSTPGMLQARIQAIGSPKRTAELANAEANRQNDLERAQILADSRVEAAQSSTPTLSFNRPGGLSGGFSGGGGLQGRSGSRLDTGGGSQSRSGRRSDPGGILYRNRVKPLEYGGKANDKEPYLVGEKGPELMVPENSGTIIPNEVLAKLEPHVLESLGVTPGQEGGFVQGLRDLATDPTDYMASMALKGMQQFTKPTLVGSGERMGNIIDSAGTAGSVIGGATKAIDRGVSSALLGADSPTIEQNLRGLIGGGQAQAQPAIKPATQSPVQTKGQQDTGQATGDRQEYSEDNPYMTFVYPESYQEFLMTDDAKELAGTNAGRQTDTIQPAQLGGATQEYQPPQADPRLQQMFDNQNIQQPGSLNRAGLNQKGAYSPADVHDRQAYINQRDRGQNLTQFTPTNFDRSGLDNYNAQGLNTSGTIQGAIPWRRDPRGLSRDQVGQLQLQQNLGGRSAKDFSAAQLGQDRLSFDRSNAAQSRTTAATNAKAAAQQQQFSNELDLNKANTDYIKALTDVGTKDSAAAINQLMTKGQPTVMTQAQKDQHVQSAINSGNPERIAIAKKHFPQYFQK